MITTRQALELCKHFNLDYLVKRIETNTEKYKEWKFDGCSGLPDEIMGIFAVCHWQDITHKCCLPHDLCYGYGEPGRRSAAHLLLLGDAGRLADPLSGEGIYSAMKSASMAAPLVLEAFDRGDFSGTFFARYDRAAKGHFDAAYRYGTWLSSLPSDHRLLQPLVRWGLMQVEKNSIMDEGYARQVGGFFTGMVPGKRMVNPKWFRRTLLG